MNTPEHRHEYKHTISQLDYYTIRRRVRAVAAPDENMGEDNRYRVLSLYFDNDDDKALKEKINGLPNREKFRIRLYNSNYNFIRLEKKSKQYGLCIKRTVQISEEEVRRILQGDTHWMHSSGNPLLTELACKMSYERLRPKTIVEYSREAYIYPYGNVRITFDSDVKTGLYSKDLFDNNTPMLSVGTRGILLLEVKYTRFIPQIISDIIQTNTRRTEPFSKYAACRIYG